MGDDLSTKHESFYQCRKFEKDDYCLYPRLINPYHGCPYQCDYCFVGSIRHRFNQNSNEFKIADIKKIEKVLDKIPAGALIRLSGLTDPLQPAEKTEKVTLRTIELMNERNIRYLIITKSALIANAEYMNALDPDLAHIQISVTCLDDERTYQYEKADPPSTRIQAIYTLQDAGFDVSLRLSPLMEEYINFRHLNSLNINKTLVEFLRVNSFIKNKLSRIDYSKYTIKHGGYRHLPLHEKFRLKNKINLPNVSVAEYVPAHHKFWVRNQNPNKLDCCNLRCANSL